MINTALRLSGLSVIALAVLSTVGAEFAQADEVLGVKTAATGGVPNQHPSDTMILAAAAAPPDFNNSGSSPAKGTATLDAIEITGKKLDRARNQLSPETGSSIYHFDASDIAALPLGDATPLNQVMLQAPGVVQDSYGQLHVRGDHANLQYRINGVIIPESISGFGQALDTRFADQIKVLTGALPAQYGDHTAGIVDIRSKGASDLHGGSISAVVGSFGHREESFDVGGTSGDWSGFVTGSVLHSNNGIENPTADRNALHDHTVQEKGFAYIAHNVGEDSRLSLMLGNSDNKFQIPDVPGQTSGYALAGAPASIDTATLNARQDEKNAFQVLTFQSSPNDTTDYQVSLFHRYSDVHYQPDALGDLVAFGIAADILRRNESSGVQADFSKQFGNQHTLRAGLMYSRERFGTNNHAAVFPADSSGNQTSNVPVAIVDDFSGQGHTWGVYVQDEWQPTKALTINYGTRYDHVATVADEQQLSPRLGMVYELTPQTRLHAGYARYFTPPATEKIDTTSVNRFAGTTNQLPSDANTAVKSERSNYYDIGLEHQLTPQISVNVDGYYRRVKNLQDEGQFGNALIYSTFNYEQGRVRGLELSSTYRQGSLAAYANFAWSRAEGRNVVTGQFNFSDDELAYIASHWVHLDHDQTRTASAGVSWRMANTTLGTDLLYGSGLRRGFANTESQPAYTQVNASIEHPFVSDTFGKFDTRLALVNLFDKSYELRDGSGIGVGAPQFGPRRSVYVGLTKKF